MCIFAHPGKTSVPKFLAVKVLSQRVCAFSFHLLLNYPRIVPLSDPSSSVRALLYFSPSADSRTFAGTDARSEPQPAQTHFLPNFSLSQKTGISSHSVNCQLGARGALGRWLCCGLNVVSCMTYLEEGLFLYHCIAKQPDGVNKLSGGWFTPQRRTKCFQAG